MAADRSYPSPLRLPVRMRLPVLGVALLLAGCTGGGLGASPWSPFMGPTSVVDADSLTVQRVRGTNPPVEPLVPEAGDVWPAQEAPRGDLSNPDEAMRNIPSYRPSLIDGAPAASSPVATPGDRPLRRGSSTPPGNLGPPDAFLTTPGPTPAPRSAPASPRLEGRALTTPSGQSVTGTGGTPRVQGYTGPGGGGAVIRDGNVETWIGPNGQPSTRVVPN
ncbi:hypothetical protein [Falsiroseomonas sp. E2-1-a20]|uniref:hypothetical protein n=1 Tax=Falsiroseomonas sp. E2-1-a20 TaxID=3239300 RepID=UPI003F361FCC